MTESSFDIIPVFLALALIALLCLAGIDKAVKAWKARKLNKFYWRCYEMYYQQRNRNNEW